MMIPTTLEDIYRYINNKKLKEIILKSIELSIQYQNVWFSQNQPQMEKELEKFKELFSSMASKVNMYRSSLIKEIKIEYLERIKDLENWKLEAIEKKYEDKQNE